MDLSMAVQNRHAGNVEISIWRQGCKEMHVHDTQPFMWLLWVISSALFRTSMSGRMKQLQYTWFVGMQQSNKLIPPTSRYPQFFTANLLAWALPWPALHWFQFIKWCSSIDDDTKNRCFIITVSKHSDISAELYTTSFMDKSFMHVLKKKKKRHTTERGKKLLKQMNSSKFLQAKLWTFPACTALNKHFHFLTSLWHCPLKA